MITGRGTSGLGVLAAAALIVWGVVTGAPARQTRPRVDVQAEKDSVTKKLDELREAGQSHLRMIPVLPDLASQLTPEQLSALASQFVGTISQADIRRLAAARLGSLNLDQLAAQKLAGLGTTELKKLAAEYLTQQAAETPVVLPPGALPSAAPRSTGPGNLANLFGPHLSPVDKAAQDYRQRLSEDAVDSAAWLAGVSTGASRNASDGPIDWGEVAGGIFNR